MSSEPKRWGCHDKPELGHATLTLTSQTQLSKYGSSFISIPNSSSIYYYQEVSPTSQVWSELISAKKLWKFEWRSIREQSSLTSPELPPFWQLFSWIHLQHNWIHGRERREQEPGFYPIIPIRKLNLNLPLHHIYFSPRKSACGLDSGDPFIPSFPSSSLPLAIDSIHSKDEKKKSKCIIYSFHFSQFE